MDDLGCEAAETRQELVILSSRSDLAAFIILLVVVGGILFFIPIISYSQPTIFGTVSAVTSVSYAAFQCGIVMNAQLNWYILYTGPKWVC